MKKVFVIDGVVVGHAWIPAGRDGVTVATADALAIVYDVADDTQIEPGSIVTLADDGMPTFSAPAPVPPKVGPIAFQMLFTADEAEAAATLKANDGKLASFWKLIDDPRTDFVDLSLQTVQAAVEYTLTAVKASGVDVDVPTRKAQILTGIVQ